MTRDWSFGEVLKVVFPLLDENDLTSCMLVSRQWRETANDEYLWKSICAKRWPSICRRPPPAISYHKLYKTFSKPERPKPLPPRISFEDLEFYIDLRSEQQLIFSEAISGSNLRNGIKNRPQNISEILTAHLDDPDFKMTLQVEPSFTVFLCPDVTISILASRQDTNKMACLINRAHFYYFDNNSFRAQAYDLLNFSPAHPFMSGISARVSLLYLATNLSRMNLEYYDVIMDVFGIEIDLGYAASSEDEALWLLDMLDWK